MLEIGKKRYNDDGEWFDFTDNNETARLKIGRAGSVEFLKAQEALERPYRKKIDRGTLGAATKRELNLRALARAILMDWDGVSADGAAIPYSEEMGVTALSTNPNLLEFVMDTALDNDNFQTEREQKIAKKSKLRKAG